MQVTMSNHKSTELALKNLEIQVGQLAKHLAEKSSNNFGANTEKNPKEECKAIMTRSMKLVAAEDEDIVTLKEQVVLKDTADKKNDEVEDERSQWREKPIIVERKEIKDNEKEIEGEKKKKKKNLKKIQKGKTKSKNVALIDMYTLVTKNIMFFYLGQLLRHCKPPL